MIMIVQYERLIVAMGTLIFQQQNLIFPTKKKKKKLINQSTLNDDYLNYSHTHTHIISDLVDLPDSFSGKIKLNKQTKNSKSFFCSRKID